VIVMIESDVHDTWRSAAVPASYLPPAFREYLGRGELPGGRGSFPHAHRPGAAPEDFKRADAAPPGGYAAGSDHAFVCAHRLDRDAIEHAILAEEEALRSPHSPTPTMRRRRPASTTVWSRPSIQDPLTHADASLC
jgi:uncharacterized protein